ncbi:MAG TPA: HIT domain-containing protein [Gemmatimonadaceae bacterium]|nr:HIT domain-containing protein [Gemmatimonadaceae bacterium]
MPQDCIFCRIVAGELPAKVVAETDDCVAFQDIDPKAPVHVVVVPRRHIPSLNDATDPVIIGKLSLLAADIAKREGISESGYRTVINTNGDAGQTVFHIHLHLLGGRAMGWPPG